MEKRWRKNYKTLFYVITIVICAFLIVLPTSSYSWAHSGRTDSRGGHYDRSTGEYHYHHGYPAHQHPNGVCPYADSAPSSISDDLSYRSSEPLTLSTKQNSSVSNDSDDLSILFVAFISGGGVAIPICWLLTQKRMVSLKKEIDVANKIITTRTNQVLALTQKTECQQKELQQFNNKLENSISNKNSLIDSLRKELESQNQKICQLNKQIIFSEHAHAFDGTFPRLSHEDILKLAGVPAGVTFDENLLPHYFNNPIVESHFRVYVSDSGKKYHRKPFCSNARQRLHLFEAINKKYEPCNNCIPYKARNYKIPKWYYRYIYLWASQKISNGTDNENVLYQLKEPEAEPEYGLPKS